MTPGGTTTESSTTTRSSPGRPGTVASTPIPRRWAAARFPPGFGVGKFVTVLYDPANPGRFEIRGWDSRAFYLIFAWVGTALTAGTLLLLTIRMITL
ncbi:DUF3592 domain-containing protein [Streptomyces pactum]|uniref:DUF3592 domain-containing protein n=1 Tax=Streptomyces pactum TaxID=68249 RepID=UPI003556F405